MGTTQRHGRIIYSCGHRKQLCRCGPLCRGVPNNVRNQKSEDLCPRCQRNEDEDEYQTFTTDEHTLPAYYVIQRASGAFQCTDGRTSDWSQSVGMAEVYTTIKRAEQMLEYYRDKEHINAKIRKVTVSYEDI